MSHHCQCNSTYVLESQQLIWPVWLWPCHIFIDTWDNFTAVSHQLVCTSSFIHDKYMHTFQNSRVSSFPELPCLQILIPYNRKRKLKLEEFIETRLSLFVLMWAQRSTSICCPCEVCLKTVCTKEQPRKAAECTSKYQIFKLKIFLGENTPSLPSRQWTGLAIPNTMCWLQLFMQVYLQCCEHIILIQCLIVAGKNCCACCVITIEHYLFDFNTCTGWPDSIAYCKWVWP